MTDVHNMIEHLRNMREGDTIRLIDAGTEHQVTKVHRGGSISTEPKSRALSQTAQAALEDLAEQHRREGSSPAETTSFLVHLAIQAARNIAP